MPLGDCTRWCEKAEPTRSGRLWAHDRGVMRRKSGSKEKTCLAMAEDLQCPGAAV